MATRLAPPVALRRPLALAALSGVVFLTFLDNTIVSVVLADVQTSLGVGVSGLQWIVEGYMLAFAALMLTGGTLGDLLGRKRVMLAGVGVFCAGSLVAALAPDARTLIVGRVVMGVGAAASEPGTLSLIRHVYPERRARARALGVWTAVSGVALALGPIAGGVLVAAGGWRSVFWFNLGFGALAGVAAAAALEESADPKGRRLDVTGLALGAAALCAATFAVIEGESAGFRTWWIVLLFALAAVLTLAFVLAERRARDPVLKLDLLRMPAFVGVNVVAFATNFAVFAVFFFTALYLELVADFSGWEIALQFLSMAAAMAVAGPFAGRWTARAGPRVPMIAGCLVAGFGMFAVDALLKPDASIAALAWALAIVGAGFGAALVAVSAAVLTLVPGERSGTAASTLNTSRELGGVVGVAVLGAIVNAQVTTSLAQRLEELGIPANFRALVISAVTHGAVPDASAATANPLARGHEALVAKVIDAAEHSFGRGLHLSLLIAAGLLFAGAAVAAVTIEQPQTVPAPTL